jgi:hypothetical protein
MLIVRRKRGRAKPAYAAACGLKRPVIIPVRMKLKALVVGTVAAVAFGGGAIVPGASATQGGVQEPCPATVPNGKAPGRVAASAVWARHGNGSLSAVLRRDGALVPNDKGGYKMRWFAKSGVSGSFGVRYWRLDEPSAVLVARAGSFGYSYGAVRSTMSQMSFSAGCWRIVGRLRNVSLSFVVQVAQGTS